MLIFKKGEREREREEKRQGNLRRGDALAPGSEAQPGTSEGKRRLEAAA